MTRSGDLRGAVAVAAAVLIIVFASALPTAAQARTMDESESPSAFAMMGDALIVRPLMIAATAGGAALFIVTLPFSALGGNTGDVGETLVGVPGRAAFVRCLGCTPKQAERLRIKRQRATGMDTRKSDDGEAEQGTSKPWWDAYE